MPTAKPSIEDDQVRHLSGNLLTRLAQGKEWATPGVQTALQRAVAGLDTGIGSASPRIQAVLSRIVDELAGEVEILTPRVHEGLTRVALKGAPVTADPGQAGASWPASRKAWFILGMLAVAVSGIAAWCSFRTVDEEPASSSPVQNPNSGTPEADPAPVDPGPAM